MTETKWVVEYNKEGNPRYWSPYPEYIARKFISEVFDNTWSSKVLWGVQKTDEQIYNFAKNLYEEKYKDNLPISYLEHYNKA